MGFLSRDPAIDFYGPLAAELRRRPALARSFYDLGPGPTRADLAGIIAGAAARGLLRVDDAEQAAEDLFGLGQGFSNLKLALGVQTDAVRAEVDGRVERGVAAFLTLYGGAPRG